MKRLNEKRRLYLMRCSRYQLKKRRNIVKKQKRFIDWFILSVPERVGLHPKYVRLVAVLIERLYEKVENGCSRIRLDFSKTEKMYSDGTLYLTACLNDLVERFPNCHFSMVTPSETRVEQVLYQVGIAKLLGRMKSFDSSAFHHSVRHWHVAHGYDVNLENAENIFDSFQGRLTPELSRSIYAGVSEAMTNCMHHAYEGENLPDACRKWWMFSREDATSGRLQVVFCDLGIGIPKSLFRESEKIKDDWLDNLKKWIASHIASGKADDDALKIRAAIEIGRTRTKLQHRGKGLKQMVSTLDQIGDGDATVEIISGNGMYRHRSRNKKVVEKALPLSDNRKTAIRGTLIHWSVPLPKREAE